jgi:hypothetical protein
MYAMIGAVFGFLMMFIGMVLLIVQLIIKATPIKTITILFILIIGAVNVYYFKFWQYVGENLFIDINISKMDELTLEVSRIKNAHDFHFINECLSLNKEKVKTVGAKVIFEVKERRKEQDSSLTFFVTTYDTVSLKEIDRIQNLMRKIGVYYINKTNGIAIFEIGGMLDTRYGFLRRFNRKEINAEDKNKIGRYGQLLRATKNGWYYFNTGS